MIHAPKFVRSVYAIRKLQFLFIQILAAPLYHSLTTAIANVNNVRNIETLKALMWSVSDTRQSNREHSGGFHRYIVTFLVQ